MRCPSCETESLVKQLQETAAGVIRKRQCPSCGHRWETVEATMHKVRNQVRQARVAVQAAIKAHHELNGLLGGFFKGEE